MKLPIKALKELSKKYNLNHIVVFATDDKSQHIATFGKTIDNCSQAADFGNSMKDVLHWPTALHAQPSRVRKLIKENEKLRLTINALKVKDANI